MKKSWTVGLSKDEADEVRADYRAAARLRERLSQMLEDKINLKAKQGRSEDLLEKPNWELTQVGINYYINAIEEVRSLLKDTTDV